VRFVTETNYVQTFGIIATLIIAVGLAIWNGHRESSRESADLMIRFAHMLNSGSSKLIMRELDLHGNLRHIRVSGDDLDDAIDDFLGRYDLLNTAYDYKLINQDMAWDAFSYELEKALQDTTIRQFIADAQGEESDVYDGPLKLAQSFGIKFIPITVSTPAPSPTPTPGGDDTVTAVTVSGNTTLSLPSYGHSTQNILMTATANIIIPQGQWAGQKLDLWICQDANGGHTPTFVAGSGLTIKGTFAAPTTVASKCDMWGFKYISTTLIVLTGFDLGL